MLLAASGARAEDADSTVAYNPDKVNVAFRTVDKQDLLGATNVIDMVGLSKKNYTTYSLDNMSSYVGGYTGELWHQGSALVLIDGVPRDAGNIHPNEIEQITFLKSAQGIALYGSRGSKGVILITTKRGHNDGLKVTVSGNASLYVPKRYPKYLGSAQYMQLYNEALENDGLSPVYSDEDIYHYANHDNDYRYPELNFFSSDYLKVSPHEQRQPRLAAQLQLRPHLLCRPVLGGYPFG